VHALYRPGGRAPDHGDEALADTDGGAVAWNAVDVLDRRNLEATIAAVKPSAIYHCAALADAAGSWTRVAATLEVNVMGTRNLVESVRRCGLDSPIVVPGSSMVYRGSDSAIDEDSAIGPTNPYAVSKLAQEMLAARAASDDGLRVLLPRAFNHIGPGQDPGYATSSFARQIAEIEADQGDPVLEVGNLDARRDVIDVRDTVRAYRLLAERGVPGRIYNVCGGRAYTMRDLLDMLVGLAGVKVEVKVDPKRLRPSDTPTVLGNPARLRDEVGWEPTIPLERTLEDLLEHWRQRVRARAART
jgi:GDP-4-dehydro-6-deoxy-D-mannose reductase